MWCPKVLAAQQKAKLEGRMSALGRAARNINACKHLQIQTKQLGSLRHGYKGCTTTGKCFEIPVIWQRKTIRNVKNTAREQWAKKIRRELSFLPWWLHFWKCCDEAKHPISFHKFSPCFLKLILHYWLTREVGEGRRWQSNGFSQAPFRLSWKKGGENLYVWNNTSSAASAQININSEMTIQEDVFTSLRGETPGSTLLLPVIQVHHQLPLFTYSKALN